MNDTLERIEELFLIKDWVVDRVLEAKEQAEVSADRKIAQAKIEVLERVAEIVEDNTIDHIEPKIGRLKIDMYKQKKMIVRGLEECRMRYKSRLMLMGRGLSRLRRRVLIWMMV